MKTKAQMPVARRFDAPRSIVDVTIEWEGVTEEEMRAMAQTVILMRLATHLRRDTSGPFPATLEIDAKSLVHGSRPYDSLNPV